MRLILLGAFLVPSINIQAQDAQLDQLDRFKLYTACAPLDL